MLILTRKLNEKIRIGDDISVTLLEIRGAQVKLGVDAPKGVPILREEIYERIREENLKSAAVEASDLSQATSLLGIRGSKEP